MQQINLYQPRFRTPRQIISVEVMVWSISLFLLLFMAYYGYTGWLVQEHGVRLKSLEGRIAEQLQHNEEMERQFPVRTRSVQLEQQLASAETLRNTKQQVLDMLNSGVVGNSSGFSGYLEGMARRRIDNLWLSNITIEAGGERMRIEGSTLQADLLPSYIQQLAKEEVFHGREFALFSMTRGVANGKQIDFSLRSREVAAGAER